MLFCLLVFNSFLTDWLQVVQSENAVAVELIATHIRRQLDDRARHFGKQMVSVSLSERLLIKDEDTENPNLILLPQTPQIMVRFIFFFFFL